MKDQHDLIRAAHIQMVLNHAFQPHPACCRPVKHTGFGKLELPKCHLISISGPHIGVPKWRRRTSPPPPEKALHCTRAEAITDLLQSAGITATTESIKWIAFPQSSESAAGHCRLFRP
jgi:hypothetical protein